MSELVHVPRKTVDDVRVVIWRVSRIRDEVLVWPDVKYFVDIHTATRRAQLELSVGKTVEVDGVIWQPEVSGALDSR